MNPLLFPYDPSSEFDSWLAVGVCGASSACPAPSAIGIDFQSWTESSPLTVTNGAVFLMDPGTGPTGSNIVVAQLTIPTGQVWTAALGVQGRSHGERSVVSDYVDYHVVFTNSNTK